ncbi:hypothetical protein [Nocardioides sp. NPDC006273]|uniref:hypothetical protein n=1 Tax=Nocardioides sp. NPDC006273 TaxID=3155598 RepID=UPI0033A9AC35
MSVLPPIPPDWDRLARPPRETLWMAVENHGVDHDRFRGTLAHTVEPLGAEIGLRQWVHQTEELISAALRGYLLIDLERLGVAGQPGGRRLAHHTGPNDEALVLEQWFVIVEYVDGSAGHTLTATLATDRYDTLADIVATTAQSWDPAEVAAGAG